MIGLLWFRLLLLMASQAIGKLPTGPAQPTKYYFAYGSNLQLKQMKKRCPNSKYIGRARLPNYRWQINQRGYANIVKADGRCVEGLVYEINPLDEAKLDINEGVSKNAYAKQQLQVHLHRAEGALYRRPTSWIVKRGGPAQACRLAKEAGEKQAEHAQHWVQKVLVYISLNYVKDSSPKEEYIKRINLGLVDAAALGISDGYVRTNIRPFIPETPRSAPSGGEKSPSRGIKRNASRGDIKQVSAGANDDTQGPEAKKTESTKKRAVLSNNPPPLPPRPKVRYQDMPMVTVEEVHVLFRSD